MKIRMKIFKIFRLMMKQIIEINKIKIYKKIKKDCIWK